MTIWLTGMPSSGKSTLAAEAAASAARPTQILDGDFLRAALFPELGFSEKDRIENVQRTGRLAVMFAKQGVNVLVPVISPFRAARDWVRQLHDEAGVRYLEVWVDAPLQVCECRDVKGLYARSREGSLKELTGVDSPYEEPLSPDLHLRTDVDNVETCLQRLNTLVDRTGCC